MCPSAEDIRWHLLRDFHFVPKAAIIRSFALASKLVFQCAILARIMAFRHQVGLESYDRFFPNQDTMPKGGLGNLIALPLQNIVRDLQEACAASDLSSQRALDKALFSYGEARKRDRPNS
jgi:hypothetical protein